MADKQTRKSRAQALQVLGRLFQQAALAATAGAPQVGHACFAGCSQTFYIAMSTLFLV